MSMLKFIHAADVHLDSPLLGLEKYEGAPVEAIRGATRRALENLVRLAIAERVDFVLLAGDLYDCDWRHFGTGLFFVGQMDRLRQNDIPVVLLSGNHDAASRITKSLSYPSNVHILPVHQPDTIRLESKSVAVHGQGYGHQAELRNLASTYPAPVPGYVNIGLLHTALDGREGHEPYAPCALTELCGKGYDYWALGHVHRRESVNGTQYPRVEYPGVLQGRNIRESGPKGCLLVSVGPDRHVEPEFRAVDSFRWAVLCVNVQGCGTVSEVIDAVASAYSDVLADAEDRPVAVRIEFMGESSARQGLEDDLAHFTAELRSRAISESGGRLWVEKVRLSFAQREPVGNSDPALSDDALSEIRSVFAEFRANPQQLSALLKDGDCGDLFRKLPADVRIGPDAADPNNPEILAAWIDSAELVLAAAVRKSEDCP